MRTQSHILAATVLSAVLSGSGVAVAQSVDAAKAYPIGNTPEEFSAQILRERAIWAKVVKEAGIKPE